MRGLQISRRRRTTKREAEQTISFRNEGFLILILIEEQNRRTLIGQIVYTRKGTVDTMLTLHVNAYSRDVPFMACMSCGPREGRLNTQLNAVLTFISSIILELPSTFSLTALACRSVATAHAPGTQRAPEKPTSTRMQQFVSSLKDLICIYLIKSGRVWDVSVVVVGECARACHGSADAGELFGPVESSSCRLPFLALGTFELVRQPQADIEE